ncbi:MAG TPA: hypothetical protein VF132_09700 [Rudaea sp.]
MFDRFKALAICLSFSVCTAAHADITSINIGGQFTTPSDNWQAGHTWNIRAILLDSSHHPIGALSAPVTFDTHAGAAFPVGFTVDLDATEPAGTIFRVYRSTMPFNVGDSGIEYADYAGVCPCAAGGLFVPANGHLSNVDFQNSGVTLPVRLQDFSAD